jgi:glycolate oxidase
MPHRLGVTLALAKFNRILRLDRCRARRWCSRRAQPGHQRGGGALGLYYAPDPSSQIACTIGGNVAENSGGVHCLKYGLTLHNVLGARLHGEGEPVELRQRCARRAGATTCWRW